MSTLFTKGRGDLSSAILSLSVRNPRFKGEVKIKKDIKDEGSNLRVK